MGALRWAPAAYWLKKARTGTPVVLGQTKPPICGGGRRRHDPLHAARAQRGVNFCDPPRRALAAAARQWRCRHALTACIDARRQINIVEPLALKNVYVITRVVWSSQSPRRITLPARLADYIPRPRRFRLPRAPTISHFEVYGASLVATIASHAQGTWIVRIRRAQSLESGLHSTEAWRPATCSCRPEGVR